MEGNPVFFTLENPIIIGIIVFIIIVILIYIFSRYFYFPLIKKYFEDRKKNSLISKIIFETDPNVLFRVDSKNNLIYKNLAFDNFSSFHSLSFSEILIELKKNIQNKVIKFNNSYYDLSIKNIPELEAVQYYLSDITEVIKTESLVDDYKKKVIKSREEEEKRIRKFRNQISMELHDSVNHKLLTIIKYLENKNNSSENLDELREIYSLIRQCSKEIKPINFEIDDFSLSVKNSIEKICKEANINADIFITEKHNLISKQRLFNLYRIIQELTTNVIKYSKAKNLEICLVEENGIFYLSIDDDGIGFEPVMIKENYYSSSGLGLINVQERINDLQGAWTIDSVIGKGTNITIEMKGDV